MALFRMKSKYRKRTKELSYYGTATSLSTALVYLAATHTKDYALFGGGDNNSGYSSVVNVYDKSLIKHTSVALSEARDSLAATHIGDYALFGGGFANGNRQTVVDAFNNSLTRVNCTGLNNAVSEPSATHNNNYALFGGGVNYNSDATTYLTAYNSSLIRFSAQFTEPRGGSGATHIGNYALFAGCYTGGSMYSAEAVDDSLTITYLGRTSVNHARSSAAYTKQHALVAGGTLNQNYKTIDVYDESLVHTTPISLTKSVDALASASVNGYAIFGGGRDTYYQHSDTVNAYDSDLIMYIPTALSKARHSLAATRIGDYALFGGGYDTSDVSNIVDVYQVA